MYPEHFEQIPNLSSPTTTKLLLGTLALLMTTIRILTVHGRPSSRCVFTFFCQDCAIKVNSRYRQIFFDQVGHETAYASN